MTEALDAMIATYQAGQIPPTTADVADAMKEFQAMRDQVIAAGTAGDYEKAHDIWDQEDSQAIRTDFDNVIDEMFNADNVFTEGMIANTKSSTNTTITILIVVVAAAVIISVLLGRDSLTVHKQAGEPSVRSARKGCRRKRPGARG